MSSSIHILSLKFFFSILENYVEFDIVNFEFYLKIHIELYFDDIKFYIELVPK